MGDIKREIGTLAADLGSVYKSRITRPLEWRLKQMEAMLAFLFEREHDICAALEKDLRKSAFEAFSTEIAVVANSCRLVKSNLKKWLAPQKISIPLVAQPASCATIAEPLGVVLIFSTWNFPLLLALDPLVGALAAGNVAVVKPSEVAPATSALLAKLLPLYIDTTAVCVVEGSVPESTILLEQKWDKIFYTGSAHVGRIIMTAAAKHLTPVTLELGGKSPVILDRNIDLNVAAMRITAGKWGINLGQTCLAPDYIIAEEKIVKDLVKAFRKNIVEFFSEDPSKSPDVCRVVNGRHFARLKSYLEDVEGKAVVYGGHLDEGQLYMEPTIVLDPPMDSLVMKEEIFGPILPIITVKTMDLAVEIVNSLQKPLVLYLFSKDEALKNKLIYETSAGSVVVNDCVVQFGIDSIPFGGVGESGMGKYHGKLSFDAFSHMKPVLYRPFWGDTQSRYPPYTSYRKSFLRAAVTFDYLNLLLIYLGLKK